MENKEVEKKEKKKGFFAKFFEKLDKKMEESVKKGSCCSKPKDGDGSSCCS